VVHGQRRSTTPDATPLLDRLEDPGRRSPHRNRVGMLDREPVNFGQHLQTNPKILSIDLHGDIVTGRGGAGTRPQPSA
jgi:hypothetical protein